MMSQAPKVESSDEHTVLINPYGDINGAADTSDQHRVMRRDTSIMVRGRQEPGDTEEQPDQQDVPTQPNGQTGNPDGDVTNQQPDNSNEAGAGGKPADPVAGASNGVVESDKDETTPPTLEKKDGDEGTSNAVVESPNKDETTPTLEQKDGGSEGTSNAVVESPNKDETTPTLEK